jgi:hypothetical protein
MGFYADNFKFCRISPLTHAVGERVRERGMVPSVENPLSLAPPAKSG